MEFKNAKWIVLTTPAPTITDPKMPKSEQDAKSRAAEVSQNHLPASKRFSHAACLVGNRMFVFGGLNAPNKGGNIQTFH